MPRRTRRPGSCTTQTASKDRSYPGFPDNSTNKGAVHNPYHKSIVVGLAVNEVFFNLIVRRALVSEPASLPFLEICFSRCSSFLPGGKYTNKMRVAERIFPEPCDEHRGHSPIPFKLLLFTLSVTRVYSAIMFGDL